MQVITCLRDVKSQLKKGCKQELFKVMMDVSGMGRLEHRAGEGREWAEYVLSRALLKVNER